MASWRLFRLLQSCCGNCWYTSRIVVVTFLPSRQAAIPSRSRDFDPDTRRHAFRLCASLRHSIFTTGSMPCWPMALGDGTPEWAESLFHGGDRGTSSTGSLRRSLWCTPAYWLDFLSYLTTDASNFQSALDPSGGRGEMAMVAPCCHHWFGTACAVGLI